MTGSASSEFETLMAWRVAESVGSDACMDSEVTHEPVIAHVREPDSLDRDERDLALERRLRAAGDDLRDEDVDRLVRLFECSRVSSSHSPSVSDSHKDKVSRARLGRPAELGDEQLRPRAERDDLRSCAIHTESALAPIT